MKLQDDQVHTSGSESSDPRVFAHRSSNWRKQASRPPFDPELHYGDGDDNALYNIFATWPESFFTSLPKPHGNSGIDEPYWELRQSRIFLDDCFRGNGIRRLFISAVPGPDKLERKRLREQLESEGEIDSVAATIRFQSALDYARQQAKLDAPLALELANNHRTIGPKWSAPDTLAGSPSLLSSPPLPSHGREQEEYEDWSGFSDTASSSQSATLHIPNPPIPGTPAFSIEALQHQVNEFAKENGFGVIRRNGSGSRLRKTRYVFQCDRYGEPRPSRGTGLRQKRSRKCGCKWKIVAEALKQNDYTWTLREFANPQHSQHNHDRSISLSAHPIHRKLTASVKATIEVTSRRVGIRALLRREKLGGLGATAALIKLFDERGIPYIVRWSVTEPDRLVGLVWTFPYCLRMWKRFPEIMSFDNTYNTNRFKLPLFQVTGQTCLKSIYNAAFGLLDNERREGFQFLAEGIRQLADQHDIPLPEVVITDFDQQMKAALNSQFPDSQQQICIHHINSNALLNAKRKWKDAKKDTDSDDSSSGSEKTQIALTSGDIDAVRTIEEHDGPPLQNDRNAPVPHNYRGVLEMWKDVTFAQTKEDYEKAWLRLCGEFNDQQAILAYLYKTYLPLSAQWAYYSTKKYRNFGVRVTSGTEASNNNVKSYLLNGTNHLYGLVEAIEGMLLDQERDFIDNCSQDEVLTARKYSGPGSEYLGELRIVMSQPGLDILANEHRHYLKSMPTKSRPWPKPIGNCNEDCSVSWQLGIPCRHTISEKLEAGTILTKWDVHPRWHLRQPTSRNPYQRILDPKIATNLRGRPKNDVQPVPESMAVNRQHNGRVGRTVAGIRSASKAVALGPGKQVGLRQSGRRTQPSIRRQPSEWETISSEGGTGSPAKRRRTGPRGRPGILSHPAAVQSGDEANFEECINVRV
ncbi:hypothetical protein HIM_09973 [Hirsutella minnesotensis 3608]|uniref:MULE transposase domain-containing protein n=1 Tax=Hirsutella minnesotensis 3608 TaxID=1043627 RepID=A0A0F7ZS31_9HYPO|nr:hypothetical protein HIM_09973 [Hirsutella minnesotensis 3608]